MKQRELLRHLRRYGCFLKRQGKEHELWSNPQTGHPNQLARKICRALSIPDP